MRDCNECKYLSCTEQEQDHLRKVFKETIPHVCIKYNKRVLHRHNAFVTGTRSHKSCINPCEECLKEDKENNEVEC